MSVDVLGWAAREVGESLPSLAEAVTKRKSAQERILRGELTIAQAKKIAALTGVPFGFLFLSQPPTLARTTIPDLRQRPNPDPLSADFFDVLEDVENKQDWFLDHLRTTGESEPLDIVGRFEYSRRPAAQTVADHMRETLRLTPQDRRSAPKVEDYFTLLSKRAEAVGVLVMKSGIVKSNTHRALSPNEFQGVRIASGTMLPDRVVASPEMLPATRRVSMPPSPLGRRYAHQDDAHGTSRARKRYSLPLSLGDREGKTQDPG